MRILFVLLALASLAIPVLTIIAFNESRSAQRSEDDTDRAIEAAQFPVKAVSIPTFALAAVLLVKYIRRRKPRRVGAGFLWLLAAAALGMMVWSFALSPAVSIREVGPVWMLAGVVFGFTALVLAVKSRASQPATA
jgi:hypothetical protein